jgi:hypothetical protein
MKRLLIFVITIFIFTVCAAPSLSKHLSYIIIETSKPDIKKPIWSKEFARFADHLKFKESSGDWKKTNEIGCLGWFQFQVTTLESLGIYGITTAKFIADPDIFPPELQEQAFIALVRVNSAALKKYEGYIGQTIKGVLITMSGLLAATHLGGIMGVGRFLTTPDSNPTDKFGSSIKCYLTEFQGYDI